MKILAVSDHLNQGGAAIACQRLCLALEAQGAQTARFCFNSSPREHAPSKCFHGIGGRTEGLLSFTFGTRNPKLRTALQSAFAHQKLASAIKEFRPDLINLHNLHGCNIKLSRLKALIGSLPVIWTLHDMWSFTGRCAYAYDCPQFVTGCTATCPTPTEYPKLAAARIPHAWAAHAHFISQSPKIAAVCPSAWLASEAKRGAWKHQQVLNIPNALPLSNFYPVPKTVARQALGLDPHTSYALLAADYLSERRKGGHFLQEALKQAPRPGWKLLLMGNADHIEIPGWAQQRLGYVQDDSIKRLVYSAATVLLHPAPVDNLPNTIAEALACGTPSAAFNIGGIPDMIVPDSTGWLCDRLDATAFATCIQDAFNKLSLGLDLTETCRAKAEHLFNPSSVASKYLDLASALMPPLTR